MVTVTHTEKEISQLSHLNSTMSNSYVSRFLGNLHLSCLPGLFETHWLPTRTDPIQKRSNQTTLGEAVDVRFILLFILDFVKYANDHGTLCPLNQKFASL